MYSETLLSLLDTEIPLAIKKEIFRLKSIKLVENQGSILWTRRLGEDRVINKGSVAKAFGVDLKTKPILVSDTQEGPPQCYRRLKLYQGRPNYYYAVETQFNTIDDEESNSTSQEGILKLSDEKSNLIHNNDPEITMSLRLLLEEQVLINS